jgi:flavin reductase (DIM6/NTAB) family NADH-FMN oxidoreductase RutF
MECTVEHMLKLGSDYLVVGRMHRYHVDDDLLTDGRIDPVKLAPLVRMAGNFSRVDEFFSLPL